MATTPTYLGTGDLARRQSYCPWWLDNLADDATGDGAFIQGAVPGASNVRAVVIAGTPLARLFITSGPETDLEP